LIGLRRTEEVSAKLLSRRCVISQPASLIRRGAWSRVGGLKKKSSL
jgi:hypothetical protein